jgi:hypothetical protein
MAQLCLIIPLGPAEGGTPTPPIYYPPVTGVPTPPIYYPPSSPGVPTHPIAPGGPPPGIWPNPGVPTHPIYMPGPPPGTGIWPSPGYPSHPIAPGGPPPGYWGGVAPPMPTPPIYWPQPPSGGGEGETKPPGAENLPPVVVWVPGHGYITALPGVPPKPMPEPPVVQPT